RLMLNSHGTCSTITALDQTIPQFSAEQRAACAKEIVRHLHRDLSASVHRNVVKQEPDLPTGLGLRELMQGREWIFQGGNYHIDISHLGSAVRFARSIEAEAPELELAIDLANYGSQLDSMLQYPGEPPFTDFYKAHLHFFNIV